VVVHHHAPSVVLWNETERRGNSLILRLHGARANRDAIGAQVRVRCEGKTLVRTLDGGGGYVSSSAPAIHFGVGSARQVDSVEVRWPSGVVASRTNVPVNTVFDWDEGSLLVDE
jgi:hypothetical protein